MERNPFSSVKTFLLVFIIVSAISTGIAQSNSRNRRNTRAKWPYTGEHVPPYIALAVGYEGLKTKNFLVGIAVNALDMLISSAAGGMVGGGLFYKQGIGPAKTNAFEAELGFYGPIVLGLNYNYNTTHAGKVSGFKPFIGLAAYNFQVFYGYSFYKDKKDITTELRHNRITLRYVIPVIRLKH